MFDYQLIYIKPASQEKVQCKNAGIFNFILLESMFLQYIEDEKPFRGKACFQILLWHMVFNPLYTLITFLFRGVLYDETAVC